MCDAPALATQILGAIFGALIYAALIPMLHIGGGAGSPGCFGPSNGTTPGEVFGWEMMMTFFLVLTVYASAVSKVNRVGGRRERRGRSS